MSAIVPNRAVTDVRQSYNFTPGRSDALRVIVIHHWGVDGQTHQGVVSYLCRANGNTSAHYVASAGRVTQIVSDRDTAWHCPGANASGIGIECRPEMSEGDFETVAQLIAAIRSEHGDLPLIGHKDRYATACPGRWYAQLAALDARARAIAGGASAAPVAPAAQPRHPEAPRIQNGLVIDGWWGPDTTRRLQQVLGTPVDGVISGQYAGNQGILEAATGGWEWTQDAPGSQVIAALQERLGVEADGLMGPKTIEALKQHYGFAPDGCLDGPSITVAFLQTALSEGRL